jgi:hypothetical protein
MPAVADLALGIAPIAGGMAIGAAAGYLKGPDVRKAIKQDLELLKELPPEQVERRAELQRSIDSRIDDLIAAVDRYQPLRRASPPIVPACAMSCCSSARFCSPGSGGASITTRATGYRCSLFSFWFRYGRLAMRSAVSTRARPT